MASTVAAFTRERMDNARAARVSTRPNAPYASGLPVEDDSVVADTAGVARCG